MRRLRIQGFRVRLFLISALSTSHLTLLTCCFAFLSQAQKNLTDSCKSTYLADPLRKKLQNLWHTLHEESLGEAEIYRNKETGAAQPDIVMKDLLVALEDGQAGFGIACCGFLPPNQCDKDIAWEGKCGVKPGWYPRYEKPNLLAGCVRHSCRMSLCASFFSLQDTSSQVISLAPSFVLAARALH